MSRTNDQSNPYAEFEEDRTTPLLINPSDYYMSVVRFSIDGSDLPLFVCPVIPNPLDATDPNYTPFTVTLRVLGNNYTSHLIYITGDDTTPPLPPTATRSQDNRTSYYYVFYYTQFITSINNAILESFNKLIIDFPAYASVPVPYYIYDPITQLISFICPNFMLGLDNVYVTRYDANNIPLFGNLPNIQIFLNTKLYSYFEGIKSFFVFNHNSINLTENQSMILIDDNKNNYYYPPMNNTNTTTTQTLINFSNTVGPLTDSYTVKPDWFIFTQQYHLIGGWNSIQSIAILTTMPIQNEFIPSFSSNSQIISGNSFREILTDFVIDLSSTGEQRGRFVYNPTAYRYIDIKSHVPLNRIQLKLYWTDALQNLYPMRISFGKSNSIKLMFIKKELINSSIGYKMIK